MHLPSSQVLRTLQTDMLFKILFSFLHLGDLNNVRTRYIEVEFIVKHYQNN